MRFAAMFVLAVSLMAADHDRKQQGRQQQDNKETRARTEATTLTGVIDQKDGKYVVLTQDSVEPKAMLRAQGFKETNFARFVGVTVRMQGRMTQEEGRDVFVVSRLADIEKLDPGQIR
jgi:hypothetical protein